MYIFEDQASNTYEEFSDDYIESHLRGTNNRHFAHMCQCQFTTHPLEINELDAHLEGALSDADITELSITIPVFRLITNYLYQSIPSTK